MSFSIWTSPLVCVMGAYLYLMRIISWQPRPLKLPGPGLTFTVQITGKNLSCLRAPAYWTKTLKWTNLTLLWSLLAIHSHSNLHDLAVGSSAQDNTWRPLRGAGKLLQVVGPSWTNSGIINMWHKDKKMFSIPGRQSKNGLSHPG